MLNELLKLLTESEKQIQIAKEEKTNVVNNIMNDILLNSAVFADIWKQNENNIKQQIKELATKHSYKFSTSLNKNFKLDILMINFSLFFPIFTYNNDYIFDYLPNANDDWEIIDNCTDDIIELDISPIDQNSRDYPLSLMDEDNPYSFVYKIPRKLHEDTTHLNKEDKTKLFLVYFNDLLKNFLFTIEEEIIKQTNTINQQISTIDFSNPAVVAALKNKLNI